MGNFTSRNDHYPVPPGFMPPVYPGYPQFSTPTSWNPFKRNQMKKREKILREYLYTTPMILQYPGAFAVTQPGQNLVQPGIPPVHTAVPVAPITNGVATQMAVPGVSAQMIVPVAAAPPTAPGAGGASAAAPVIPSQMAPITYPTTFDYSSYLDPRGAAAPDLPRRSRRSQRHSHRRRRRSPTPTTEDSGSEAESRYSDPSSYDSADYPRYNRQHHNPLPRPPKDILASTPFRPLLTQLPSSQYNSWGLRGTVNSIPQPQSQPPPQPDTYGNVRPRRQRRGLFSRGQRDAFNGPSFSAAANALVRPFMGSAMAMPEPQPVLPQPPLQSQPPRRRQPTPGPVIPPGPPVIPPNIAMHMPSPDQAPPPQVPPVIPPGSPMPMPMPNPGPAGSTPFVGIGANLGTPRHPPGPTMPMAMMPSPSSGPVPMPTPMTGPGPMPIPMPSPAVGGGGLPQTPMNMPAPGGGVLVTAAMAMPSPSLGAGMVPQVQAPVLKFNGYGEYKGLLYHSPHTVLYEDELYPTALHLFEARKFLDHRPDLADRIRRCERVEEVTAISAELADFTRRDWGNVALSTMDDVLYQKFRQHGDLRTLLLNTYPAELVYVESGDPFWGDGAGVGMNHLGQSLMRVRERLRLDGGM